MYIVRDIFNLKYGHFRPVKAMMDEAMKIGMMPNSKNTRILSDFTGGAYRLVMETGFDSLAALKKNWLQICQSWNSRNGIRNL
jgi:hypothetical protein